jgi:hypothetical protein
MFRQCDYRDISSNYRRGGIMPVRVPGIIAAAALNDGRVGDVRPVVGSALVGAAQAVA